MCKVPDELSDENLSAELLKQHHLHTFGSVTLNRHALCMFGTHMPKKADILRAMGAYDCQSEQVFNISFSSSLHASNPSPFVGTSPWSKGINPSLPPHTLHILVLIRIGSALPDRVGSRQTSPFQQNRCAFHFLTLFTPGLNAPGGNRTTVFPT